MQLADLLLTDAEGPDGKPLGQVHDVRLRHSMTPDGRHRLVVEGVIVGAGAGAARLGYAYGDVQGPWLLTVLMRWLSRRSRYVSWRDLHWDRDQRRITTTKATDQLPRPAERELD